ncbi:hypothetical protein IFR05_000151 [Cadophora sp. M221]|nr:hypothetical protein IFR05_000151 [Cadophora sp. M221]
MSKIEFIPRAFATARQRIATSTSDVKATLTSGPLKPTPNQRPKVCMTCLENDRYNHLHEQVHSIQLRKEKHEGSNDARFLRLELECLQKASDNRIKDLGRELASAHAETREFDKKLSAEISEHQVTKSALKNEQIKVSACQEHFQKLSPPYHMMKESYDAAQAELLLLKTNQGTEKDRRDEAVQRTILEKDQQIFDLKKMCAKLTATNDFLQGNF